MPAARVADYMKASQPYHTEIHVSEAGINSTRPYTEKPDISEDAIVNIRTYRRPAFLEKRQHSYRDLGDESPDLRRPSDVKQKQNFKGRQLVWLAYQSIGVVFGDLSTSPLYVFSSTFNAPPAKQDLLGILSLMIWSMTIMITIKYVLIILYADNDGEGGSFSMYSLLCRYLKLDTDKDDHGPSNAESKRPNSGDLGAIGRLLRDSIERSIFVKRLLQIIAVLAVTMIIADAVLTPAQSVLGAVQGSNVVSPDIGKTTPLGISRMTVAFSPKIILWLGLNAAFGIYNLIRYDVSVFKAFNPGLAISFLIRNDYQGWKQLGGVLLSFAGVETLFANLGNFSRGAIQLSWFRLAYPCLLLAYVGQAAYISVHPEAYNNPFSNAAPPGTLYPALIIAILAAIVASQAVITATLQLLSQVMKLSYIPHIKVVHTSKTFHGQVYVPTANWLLMIGCILVTYIYDNTTSLGHAYVVCVMFVTFFDTCMVALAAVFVWRFSPFLVFIPWLLIACHDGSYLSLALDKVPTGGWFTLTLSAILAVVFLCWRYGKTQQWASDANALHLTPDYTADIYTPLSSIHALGVFFDKPGDSTPPVFSQFAINLTALPSVSVFFHLRPFERPSVPAAERYSISRLAIPNCYRMVVRYGFNDTVVTPDLGAIIYQQVRQFLHTRAMTTPSLTQSETGGDGRIDSLAEMEARRRASGKGRLSVAVVDEVQVLDEAYKSKVLYVVAKEEMRVKEGSGWWRSALLQLFLWMRDNSKGKVAGLKIPAGQLVEVGFVKEI
ncbi:hypothetical protein B9Z65_2634 [Elsinoe australis]|uniref:Potassium transporter 5 n=1 Tax=Elsinoe australis TaxID=40998 RepID=A0A2P8A444_9PEZI|nr:hypothetical protein B9Z65_2634 [Elsinoe australis]